MKLKMRKIVSMMAVLCLVTGLFVLISSGESTHADTKELESIEVTKNPDKLLYEDGEAFDPTGMVITAHYTDGTSAPVNDYYWDWTGSLFYDITSIRISYTEGEITSNVDLTITVNPELEQLEVLTPPAKTVYNEGELFDPTGMVVQATYSNNTTEIITNYTVNFVGGLPTYGKASRDIDIEISYTYGRETEYAYQTVTVNRTEERTLTGLSINTSPDKLVYEEGESLNLSGLILIATYDNGKSVQVEWLLRSVTEEPGNDLFATDNKFTISYTENEVTKSVDQPITVNPWTKKLTDIAVTTPPTKVDYKVGESFKKNGMEVTATFDDGTQDILYPERYDVNPSGPLDIGDTVITITYTRGDGIVKTTTQNITVSPVSPLDRIEITTPPTKVEYVEGADFDLSGMVVTATYSDGSTKIVKSADEYIEVTPLKNLKVTDTIVTVTYSDGDGTVKTATQPITVKEKVVLTDIMITIPPTKVEYFEGDEFSTSGMVVVAKYSDNTTKVIKNRNEYILVEPIKNLQLTDSYVTVIYTDGDGTKKTTTQPITVREKPVLKAITIIAPPTKVEYYEGDEFSTSGMVVVAKYSNDTTEVIKNEDEYILVEPLKNLQLTDSYVTVIYTDGDGTEMTTTQPITVRVKPILTGIRITTPPTKTEYMVGNTFDQGGMVVVAEYHDGSTKVIKEADGFINLTPLYNLQTTDSYITLSYAEEDITVTTKQYIVVKSNGSSSNYGNGQSSSGSGSNSGNYGSGSNTGNSGSVSSTGVSVSTPTPTPKVVVPGTTTQEVENKDGSKTTTTKTVEESGKVTETTVKEYKNGDKTTTEVVTDNSGKMVSTVTEIVSTDNKGTTTVTTTDRKSDGSVTGSTIKTYESGKVVSTVTETNADKSVKIVEETKHADGSSSKTVTNVSAGGTAKMTTTVETPAVDDKEAKKTEFVYSMTEVGKAKLVKVTTDENEITIPATVTINDIQCKVVTIGKDAFEGNTSITKVVLGKYVETIGTKAFAGLKNLKEITISSSKLSKVSKSAFYKISKEAKFYIKAKKSVCKSIAALIKKSGIKKVNYTRVK